MKKIAAMALALLLLAGCGGSKQADTLPEAAAVPTAAPTEAPTLEPTTEPTPEQIQVDEGLLTVTITVPAEYVGEKTQADLDAEREEHGYKSEVLNEDGSVTLVMTKKQHRELISSLADTIEQGMQTLAESADYPDIEKVEAGENYASFTVTLNTEELSMNDTFAAWSLFMYGGLYNAYIENGAESVHVKYVDSTGNILYEADSSELKF